MANDSSQTVYPMNRKKMGLLLLMLIAFGVLCFILLRRHANPKRDVVHGAEEGKGAREDTVRLDAEIRQAEALKPTREQSENAVVDARGILASFGWTPIPTAEDFLRKTLATHNSAQILRAFNEIIYSGKWKMSEAIPALKSVLDNPDLSVRYLAAKDLLTVGDGGAVKVLIQLAEEKNPVDAYGKDLRVDSAVILAKFQETDARDTIATLFNSTQAYAITGAMADLGMPLPEQAISVGFQRGSEAIREYTKMNATNFIPQIEDTFQSTQKVDLKMAAAWALATMRGDQDAVAYLVQTAQPAINGTPQSSHASNIDALRYLGSIQSPIAKSALEAALNSQDPAAAEIAVANLIFNQNGSDKAIERVRMQINGDTPPGNGIDVSLLLSVAARFQNDPSIQAAGQRYSVGDERDWQLYTVERKNWPIYSWIWNYTYKLNK